MQNTRWFTGLSAILVTGTALAAPFQLCDTTIHVTISGSGRYTYVHLHENESASLQAAYHAMRTRPGKLIALVHGGQRMIRFKSHGKSYQFDPNRIYTDGGLHRSLATQSHSPVTPEAVACVKKLANTITSNLSGTIIALHNNANDSFLKYSAGGAFARNVSTRSRADRQNPHNFFIVTERSTFDSLKAQGFNVVLQDNRRVADDGSLSVYAARHGLAYINVEAAFGAVAAQTKMLSALP